MYIYVVTSRTQNFFSSSFIVTLKDVFSQDMSVKTMYVFLSSFDRVLFIIIIHYYFSLNPSPLSFLILNIIAVAITKVFFFYSFIPIFSVSSGVVWLAWERHRHSHKSSPRLIRSIYLSFFFIYIYYFVLFFISLSYSSTSYEKLVYKNSIIRRPLRLTIAR